MPDYSGKYLDGPGLEHLMGKIKQLIDSGGVVLDPTPTSGSTNGVTSGGVYTALAGKADSSHEHAAGDITSGTLAIGRIPTGTTASTVALGNHTHSAYAAADHDHAAGDITSGTLAKARGGTGADGSSVAANRVLASPNGSTGAVSFRALVAADLPDITFNALSDAAITERAAHYSTSINNATTEYKSAGATGWTYIKIANTVFAWGFISASVAISTAFGSIYISGADRYFRLPVAMTNIVSCIFGTAFGGSQNSGVSAVLRGNNADYLPTSGSLYCLPFRFTCTASVGTAATSKVPVMLVGRAA